MAKTRATYNVRVDVAGGFIALGLDVNLSELDDYDREFVNGLLMTMLDRAREQALKRSDAVKASVLGLAKEEAETALIDGKVIGTDSGPTTEVPL